MSRLELAPLREQVGFEVPGYQHWRDPQGVAVAEFYSFSDRFLVRFPRAADFEILRASGNVICHPCAGTDAWKGIYEQQVQPLLLSLRGEPIFHGGAVALGDVAVAFLAPSGRGKSTLTTAFARRGHAFLSDDCLHLDLTSSLVRALPHADHVRLWEDSAAALGEGAAAYVPGSPKPRLAAGQRLPHCDHPLLLSRVYLLGEGDVETPLISPVSPSQQLIGWTANAFVLDIKNPDVLRRNLAAAARLVREVPMRRLDYPRRYELLDDVVDAVLADVAA